MSCVHGRTCCIPYLAACQVDVQQQHADAQRGGLFQGLDALKQLLKAFGCFAVLFELIVDDGLAIAWGTEGSERNKVNSVNFGK